MAYKWTLVFFVLITGVASSAVEQLHINAATENHHHHHHAKAPDYVAAKAPVHAPMIVPVHAPAKTPAYAPKTAPFHARVKTPIYSPKMAPVHPPASSPSHGCVSKCEWYCRPVSPKRACMRTCTACCAKFNCVPGLPGRCSTWDKVESRGYLVKCP